MRKWTIITSSLLVLLFTAVFAYTHSGGLDADGGHYNHATGDYHYHSQGTKMFKTKMSEMQQFPRLYLILLRTSPKIQLMR